MRIFGMGKCKFIANFSATMVTSLPSLSVSLSLSLCLYLSLSLSPKVPHAQYRKRFRASYNERHCFVGKCAKFHWDTCTCSPAVKELFNLASVIELSKAADFVHNFLYTTLYRNPIQVSNFDGAINQLFLGNFLCDFHRRYLLTSSIPRCKKIKNGQKLKWRVLP